MHRRLLWGLVGIVAFVALLPAFVSNLALVALTRTMVCTSYSRDCRAGMSDMTAGWTANPALYSTLTTLVAATERISLFPETLRLRRAELLVAQQHYAEAAALLPPLTAPRFTHDGETEMGVLPSRLLVNGSPEQAILAAYQAAAAGNNAAAIRAMRVAIATAPEQLTAAEWQAYDAWRGVVRQPITSRAPSTATLYPLQSPVGWGTYQISGVKIETSTIRDEGQLPMWLVGNTPPAPPKSVMLSNGQWEVAYSAINLAPNPSFEWGEETVSNGIVPSGYYSLLNHGTTTGLTLSRTDDNTHLALDSNAIVNIRSYPIAVDPNALYLMGSTAESSTPIRMGRRCYPPQADFRIGLWLNSLADTDMVGEWQAAASPTPIVHLAHAHPFEQMVTCQLMVEINNGTATMDDVFFIKIE